MKSLIKTIQAKFDSDWDVSNLPAYVDESQDELIVRQVHEARTMGLINVQEGIKGKQDLHLMDDTIDWQDASDCGLTESGDTELGRRTIETHPIGWMKGWCNKKLNGFWAERHLRAGYQNQQEELPFEAQITDYLMRLNALDVDKALWLSDSDLSTGNLQFFDGFAKLFDGSNDVIEGNITGATAFGISDSGSTIDIYNALVSIFTETSDNTGGVAEDEMFTIFMGRNLCNMLVRSYVAKNWYHYNPEQLKTMDTMDLIGFDAKIEIVPGLNNTNKIYAGKRNHLTAGVDLESDSDSYELWYEKKDDKIYARSQFRLGVQVPYLDEVAKFTLAGSGSGS